MTARTTALSALIACRKTNAWIDGVLKEYLRRDQLDARDAALASRLCYGVVQNRMLLDDAIQFCLHGKLGALQPIILDILRIGAYQILMMDKIPVSAAVNEAVEQGKKYANPRAAGLINGVLRTLAREKDTLPQPTELSIRYSHSEELVALLRESVGDALLEPLLRANNESPPTAVQVNTLCTTTLELCEELKTFGVETAIHPWLPDCLLLSGSGNLPMIPAFSSGKFYVQDPAARLCTIAAELVPGMRVLDACAAPGGKSFAAAIAMGDRGKIFACDIHAHKIALLEHGAKRLKLTSIEPVLQDGRTYRADFAGQMDVVLCDVPCSGLGVIRKKPDIRNQNFEQAARLPEIQAELLRNLAEYVRPGGVLLYSTCTVLRRENEDVVQEFLAEHPDFSAEAMRLPVPGGENYGMLTLLPCIHDTDGFFLCRMRKQA